MPVEKIVLDVRNLTDKEQIELLKVFNEFAIKMLPAQKCLKVYLKR